METKLKKYFISIFQENLNIIYQKIFLTFIVVGHMTKKCFHHTFWGSNQYLTKHAGYLVKLAHNS